jgi:CRP/FNR family transcriptional regulator
MDNLELKQQLLTLFPAFRQMSDTTVEEVLRQSPLKHVPVGTVLFTPGTQCQMFPLVLSGVVRVSRVGPKGRELPLYRVRPGESCVLTTTCLLGNTSYNATGIVETDLSVIAMPSDVFNRLLNEEPAFRLFVFGLFKDRVSELMQLVEEVAFRKLDQRLANLLVSMGNPVRVTHQQLADELGSVREMISRVLRSFEERGWVSLGREQIDVRDVDSLKSLATGQ